MMFELKDIKILTKLTKHYKYEKTDEWEVVINAKLETNSNIIKSKQLNDTLDYVQVEEKIIQFVTSKRFILIEEILDGVLNICLSFDKITKATVEVAKYNVLHKTNKVSVSDTRSKNVVFLALGSNLGNKIENITKSLNLLQDKIHNIKYSCVYESAAVLLSNSPKEWDIPFYNMAIKCNTKLNPFELFEFVKKIEKQIGRKNSQRFSPREIDIDIIFYNNEFLITDELKIPHNDFMNRDFVIFPLLDLDKNIISCNFINKLKKIYDKDFWNNKYNT